MRPADGFPPLFAYNSIRIPLYLGMGGRRRTRALCAVRQLCGTDTSAARLFAVDTRERAQGRRRCRRRGYTSIAALTLCAANSTPLPREFHVPAPNENYYPSTLHLLSLVAAQMRYRSCMRTQ